jgi:hypothetical protein
MVRLRPARCWGCSQLPLVRVSGCGWCVTGQAAAPRLQVVCHWLWLVHRWLWWLLLAAASVQVLSSADIRRPATRLPVQNPRNRNVAR